MAEQQVTSLVTQLVNSRAPEIAIYLRTYLCAFHRSGVNSLRARSALVLHEQTRITATRRVLTAVIRLVDQFQTVEHLQRYI